MGISRGMPMQIVPVEGELPGREVAPLGSGERASWSRELIKAIAADIGADMVAYIEVQYPEAIKATSSTFKTSVRNHIYNQVMAAIEITDAAEIEAWLKERKRHRREWVAAYRKIRRSPKVTNGERQ
jgi:hypothetical protein